MMRDDLTAFGIVGLARHQNVFGRALDHVEVAKKDKRLRSRRLRVAVLRRSGQSAALHRIGKDMLLEVAYLQHPLLEIDVVEMDRIDPDRLVGHHDQRFQRRTLKVAAIEAPGPWKEEIARRNDRPARKHHVAELQTPVGGPSILVARPEIDVHSGTENIKVIRQKSCKASNHVGSVVANEVSRHLLKRNDVGPRETRHDSFKPVPAVLANSVLDIVCDEFHRPSFSPCSKSPRMRAYFALERCHHPLIATISLADR